MLSELFTLEQVAEQFQWSRRTLVRMLRQHAIATIGKGRRARLAAEDIETLKAKSAKPRRGECLRPNLRRM
jgi:excisionase family DNA binding protein